MSVAVAATLTLATSSDSSLGTAGNVWGGNKALFTLLDYLSNNNVLAGARVLALGSGTGLLELCAAARGACVVATDLPVVLPLLHSNGAANEAVIRRGGGSFATAPLEWGQRVDFVSLSPFFPLSFVFASDCVYWPELFAPLISTFTQLCDAQPENPPPIYFTLEARTPRELTFFDLLEDAGFEWSLVDGRHAPEFDALVGSACAVFCARRLVLLKR
jgi:hypothetical protein